MSAIARHHARLTVDIEGTVHDVPLTDVEVTLDEERAPYIQAAVEGPLSGVLRNIDPTESVVMVDLIVTRSSGRYDRIRDLTRRYRDRILAYITDRFTPGTIANITDSLYHDYVTPGAEPTDQERTFRLMIRSITLDHAADTGRVALTGAEGILMDHALMDTNGYRLAGGTLAAKVDTLLGYAAQSLTDPPTGTPVDADIGDEATWATGQSMWSCAQALTRAHGYQLWADENGDFHLAVSRPIPSPRSVTAGTSPDRSITNVVETRSRDDGWTNAVLVEYTYNDKPTYDVAVASPAWPHKVHQVTVDREGDSVVALGMGRAQATLDTLAHRHAAFEVLAVSDYLHTTGGAIDLLGIPGQGIAPLRGHASAIRWQLPQDQMSIRLRDVREYTP